MALFSNPLGGFRTFAVPASTDTGRANQGRVDNSPPSEGSANGGADAALASLSKNLSPEVLQRLKDLGISPEKLATELQAQGVDPRRADSSDIKAAVESLKTDAQVRSREQRAADPTTPAPLAPQEPSGSRDRSGDPDRRADASSAERQRAVEQQEAAAETGGSDSNEPLEPVDEALGWNDASVEDPFAGPQERTWKFNSPESEVRRADAFSRQRDLWQKAEALLSHRLTDSVRATAAQAENSARQAEEFLRQADLRRTEEQRIRVQATEQGGASQNDLRAPYAERTIYPSVERSAGIEDPRRRRPNRSEADVWATTPVPAEVGFTDKSSSTIPESQPVSSVESDRGAQNPTRRRFDVAVPWTVSPSLSHEHELPQGPDAENSEIRPDFEQAASVHWAPQRVLGSRQLNRIKQIRYLQALERQQGQQQAASAQKKPVDSKGRTAEREVQHAARDAEDAKRADKRESLKSADRKQAKSADRKDARAAAPHPGARTGASSGATLGAHSALPSNFTLTQHLGQPGFAYGAAAGSRQSSRDEKSSEGEGRSSGIARSRRKPRPGEMCDPYEGCAAA